MAQALPVRLDRRSAGVVWPVAAIAATLICGAPAARAAHPHDLLSAAGDLAVAVVFVTCGAILWADDRAGFARTWQWTSGHLTNREGLLAWKWNGAIVDANSATDADTDTDAVRAREAHVASPRDSSVDRGLRSPIPRAGRSAGR